MNRTFGKKIKIWALSALAVVSAASFTSCVDEVNTENRFTFKGELISGYLESSPERFSSFCEILSKARIGRDSLAGSMLKTLSTYGSYTCFAPTNEAVELYIQEQYEEYMRSVEEHEADSTKHIINTGITSPYLSDLSDSMASVIARNHLIERGYLTSEVGEGGKFPTNTMNGRITQSETLADENGRVFVWLNNTSRIIEQDLEMENGIVHVIDKVLAPSSLKAAELLATYPSFSVFNSALQATGWHERLTEYEIDPDYDNTEKGPAFETQNKQTPPVPKFKHKCFTLLVESDDLLADPSKNSLNMAITNLDELEEFASHWYGTEAPGDYTNPKNAVYKFVAYHILDRQLVYSSSSGPGGFIMENYYNSDSSYYSETNMPKSFDRYDYFETNLPYTMVKVTKPFTNNTRYYPYSTDNNTGETYWRQQIVINYAQNSGSLCNNPEMAHHINVVVEPISVTKKRPGLEKFNPSALNGMIHTIDRILVYNEDEMVGNVLRERMRWDVISLFPELTSNEVRWQQADEYTLTYIPLNYSTRLRVNNETSDIYYLRPHSTSLGGYVNYQGDELLVTGKYDFEYRIPHVPTGTYEIRFGFSQSDARGVAQFYLDGKICGIPVDMRNTSENQITIGWFDEDGMTEAEIRESDKAMRNRGFMKGPASCHPVDGQSMRESVLAIRKIIGTFRLDQGDHWLRFKDVMENSTGKLNEFNQDYLEIVPTIVISDPTRPEDQN